MAITTRDLLVNAMGNNFDRIIYNKASLASAVGGQVFSLWTATGVPGAGAIPAAAAIPTKATVGAIPFTNQTAPAKAYIGSLQTMNTANSGSNFEIHDRIAHMGGLSGIVATAQTVGIDLSTLIGGVALPADRLGAIDYSDVQWWIEVYTAMGATAVNATCAVTYDDATTGNLAVVALGATPRAGRMYPLLPAVAGRNIRAVNSVTLSATTGTAGSFGVTATRQKAVTSMGILNMWSTYDWAQIGLPGVANDSCLFGVMPCQTTTTGQQYAAGKIVYG